MRAFVFVSVSGWLAGCGGDLSNEVGRVREDLGTFGVEAELIGTTCGEGAPVPEQESGFEVRLQHEGADLAFRGGLQGFEGTLDTDAGTFVVGSETYIEVTPPDAGAPGCALIRENEASGTLESSGEDVKGFDGTLSARFTVPEGVDCAPLVGLSEEFAELPCEVEYALRGIRRGFLW